MAPHVNLPVCRVLFAFLLSPGLLAIPVCTLAQQPPLRRGPSLTDTAVTVVVSVREIGGMPLPGNAFVKLSSNFSGVHLTAPTQNGATATFPNVQSGEYEIEVSSTGYKTANEHASIMAGGSNFLVFVYMHPEAEVATTSAGGAPVVSPRLQSEIDKGMDKLRREQYGAAREHLEKAAKMAPANPDVQYLLGLLEYRQQNLDAARSKFENAISIYPTHERSLLAMGELLLRTGQPAEAAQSLEKAYQINGADWRTHLLLGSAYAAQKEYEKAAPHAERAVELAKNSGAAPQLLIARIRVAQSKKSEARQAFEAVIRDFPSDSAAAEAKKELASLESEAAAPPAKSESPAVRMGSGPEPTAPALLVLPVLVRPWAPPDIDAKEYPVVQDVACSLEDVLQRAQLRTAKQLGDFEKFVAIERVEHQEVDANGVAGPVRAQDFNYLVFIKRPREGYVFLEEERDGGENLGSFPTSLASKGLVALGVYIFDPQYEPDFAYRCEGLGQWREQPAWELRFEQRREVPSRIRTWRNSRGLFQVPLKGRVWLSANSYDVLHIETDLREPQKTIELDRDHLVIDYGPVQFEHGKTSLWLPWHAELFMELHGKRYHHRHTLTNYELFSVDTTHSVSAPKEQHKEN